MNVRMITRRVALAVLVMAGNLGWAASTIQPRDRLTEDISDSNRVTVSGNVHPALAHAVSEAVVDSSFPMEHMILLLQPEPAQQAALDQLVAQQHDPHSSQFHQFLTPEQYAARFGVSQNDIDKITGWLRQQGFQVEEVTANHLSIIFSGDAHAVENAFKTEVKQYRVNGELHYANASEPQIPAALASVVKSVVKLHDFHARSSLQGLRALGGPTQPVYTASSSTHYVAPADWAMIYNVRPLYAGNLNGSGQSIAVVGRSNINPSDIQSFRTQFGLPASNPTVIIAQGSDPGFTSNGDSAEATLDVEWAGAIAPQAQVKFVISASTATADGVALAAGYAVNHNVAPVLSVSYGACEADMGSSQVAFYNALWQQAAAQGISVFVSSGDSGAAGCDSSAAASGTVRGVNGICSSPYATCVGGTEFNEGSNPGSYWLAGNNPTLGSAQSYIPEVVWNESAANHGTGLAAGGGGASTQFAKPVWQTGPGVPADGHRDVPDVAVTAASHDGYMIVYNGSPVVVGGTSAAAPSFASLFTIINQKWNSTQGNANPILYPLALKQQQGGGAVFHDIVSGNSTVPGVTGFSAAAGFDLATGLGSIDAYQLVNHWRDVLSIGAFTLSTSATGVNLQPGKNATVAASVTVSNGFNSPVSLTLSGVPSGVVATLSQSTIPAPGSGASSLQLAAGTSAAAGAYTVIVTATGGGITQTASMPLTVTAAPQCSLTAAPTSLSMTLGQSTNVRLTCTSPHGALPGTLALSVSGQPAGVTTAFSPAATLTPGTGTTNLTITTQTTAAAGNYTFVITASGGTFSQTINLPMTLLVPPSFSLALSSSSVSATQTTPLTTNVTVTDIGAFSNAISLTLSGMPTGMTGSLSTTSFAAPGAGTSTLTLTPSLSTPLGKYTVSVLASGGGLTKSVPLTVTVTAAPSFTFTESLSALSVQASQAAGSVNLAVSNLTGGFSAPVTFSIAGLPAGVTAVFTPTSLAAPGTGTSTLALTAAATATAGQYRVTISAAGGPITQSVSLLLTVLGVPGFTLQTSVPSLLLTAGATYSSTVSIVPQNNFNSPVTLALGTLPAGITAALSSSTLSGATGTATLTIQTASTLANGTYSFTLSGTSSVITTPLPSQTATIQVTVGSVQTSLAATALAVRRGSTGTDLVTVTATNFAGPVIFSASSLPPGVSFSYSPNAFTGSGSTTLTLSVTTAATPATYTIYVRTGAGGTTMQTPLALTIQ